MQDRSTATTVAPRPDAQSTGKLIGATLLRQALGFRDCPRAVIDETVTLGHVVALGKGQTLVQRGDPFDKLCLVIEGSLEVSVSHRNGRRFLLAYLPPGSVAGMMSLWDQLPHPSDMTAREGPTRVLLIDGDAWRAQCQRHLGLGPALERQMAYRTRLLHDRLIVDSSMTLEMRLARQLHLLSVLSGRAATEGAPFVLRLSQADIGDLLGVGRPRANSAVQQLRKEHLIELQYAAVVIVDAVGLARRAGL